MSNCSALQTRNAAHSPLLNSSIFELIIEIQEEDSRMQYLIRVHAHVMQNTSGQQLRGVLFFALIQSDAAG